MKKPSIFNPEQFEKVVGGMKFGITTIIIFTIVMIVGTFVESFYVTDFAKILIYRHPIFMFLKFFILLRIIFAAFTRLPPKKRLYGFYAIHTGLVMIGCGAMITYIAGVDASIFLSPNNPTRNVILEDHVLTVRIPSEGKRASLKLPYDAFSSHLDREIEGGIKLLDYYPFSERVFKWFDASKEYINQSVHSSRYSLSNSNVSENFLLSLHPESEDYSSSLSMGPLSVIYLPQELSACFGKESQSGIILWNNQTQNCQTLEERKIEIQKTSEGNEFFVIREEGKAYSFFPDFSPWPLDKNFKMQRDFHIRVFARNLFEKKPYLFLFGKSFAYFDKNKNKWFQEKIDKNQARNLPWMGFELRLLSHKEEKVPFKEPQAVMPIQKNNEVIRGKTRSLQVQVGEKKAWVTNQKPLQMDVDGKTYHFELARQTLTLPFELVLKRFNMDKDPGTNRAASYESFVTLFSPKGPQDHHIYMNNPLKYDGFTFYQASYSQDSQGNYSSTLTVNLDQGRPLKYLGSLFLVFGSIWHFGFARKKVKSSRKAVNFKIQNYEVST